MSTTTVTSSEPEARARVWRAARGDGRDSQTSPSLARRSRIDSDPTDDDAPEPACFSLAALLRDLRPHAELDLRTLAYHLRQCDATAADGYCHAAINEARSFLEALVVNIVHVAQRDAVRAGAGENGRDRSQNGTAFRTYRRYLLETGFIDADENDLLQYVYSVASAKGGHHGVTDEAWTRLARRIVFATGQYLLQRYAAWKHNGPTRAPATSGSPDASRNDPRSRWLGRILRWLPAGWGLTGG